MYGYMEKIKSSDLKHSKNSRILVNVDYARKNNLTY